MFNSPEHIGSQEKGCILNMAKVVKPTIIFWGREIDFRVDQSLTIIRYLELELVE